MKAKQSKSNQKSVKKMNREIVMVTVIGAVGVGSIEGCSVLHVCLIWAVPLSSFRSGPRAQYW